MKQNLIASLILGLVGLALFLFLAPANGFSVFELVQTMQARTVHGALIERTDYQFDCEH